MRQGLAAACLLVCGAHGAAQAAEPATWRGFYAGLSIGASVGGSKTSYSDYPAGTFASSFADGIFPSGQSLHPSGALPGALAGYNWQTGPVVFGIEADLLPGGLKGSTTYSHACGCGNVNTLATQTIDWLATLRGRIGIAPADGLILFGTAGLAVGHVQSTFTSADDGGFFSLSGESSGMRAGFVYGAGGEYAITRAFSARVEYLHYDLGKDSIIAPYTVLGTPTSMGLVGDTQIQGDIVRAAITYKFQ